MTKAQMFEKKANRSPNTTTIHTNLPSENLVSPLSLCLGSLLSPLLSAPCRSRSATMASRKSDNPHSGDGASPGFVPLTVFSHSPSLSRFYSHFPFLCRKIFIGGLAKDTTLGHKSHAVSFII